MQNGNWSGAGLSTGRDAVGGRGPGSGTTVAGDTPQEVLFIVTDGVEDETVNGSRVQSLMSTWISEMSRQILFLIGGIVLLTLTHPRLTTTTLAVVPVVIAAAFGFGRRLRKASTGVQDKVAEAMASADEAFSQIRTVQSFHREADEARAFESKLSDVVVAAIRRAGTACAAPLAFLPQGSAPASCRAVSPPRAGCL